MLTILVELRPLPGSEGQNMLYACPVAPFEATFPAGTLKVAIGTIAELIPVKKAWEDLGWVCVIQ